MLLIQPKRFQFNKSYIYGSAAFVTGFAGVLGILVHFAPVRISQADVAQMKDSKTQQASTETATATQSAGDTQEAITTPTNATSRANSSTTTPAKNSGEPAPTETPAVEEVPIEPEVPVTPTDPIIPIIPDPIPELPIEIPVVESSLLNSNVDIM